MSVPAGWIDCSPNGCRYSHDIAVRTLQFLEASECLRVSAERNGSIGSRGTPENCERIGHE